VRHLWRILITWWQNNSARSTQFGHARGITAEDWTRQLDRLRLKRDGTRAETTFRLSPKRTSPFKSAGASVQSNAGSRVVRISGSNAGYTTFRGSVKSTGYPLHSPVSSSLPLPCVTLCHQVSNTFYQVQLRFHSHPFQRSTHLYITVLKQTVWYDITKYPPYGIVLNRQLDSISRIISLDDAYHSGGPLSACGLFEFSWRPAKLSKTNW
jgi:hypothetical protein